MHVAHIEARALTRQPARSQCRQPALMRQLRQRIRLVHKLRKLRPAKELAHSRHHRPDVYQRRGRSRRRIYLRRHALLDDPLHPQQSHAHLVLYQLAHRAHTPVAKMVDVVRRHLSIIDADHHLQQRRDVFRLQRADLVRRVPMKAAVQLVPAHTAQIVAPVVVEQVLDEVLRVVQTRRLARAQPAIKLQQRLLLSRNRPVPLYRRAHILVLRVRIHIREHLQQFLVRGVSHRPQQCAHCRLALAVNLHRYHISARSLKLHPRPAIRYQLRRRKPTTCVRIRCRREVHARRAHKLAHHHALRPVDDESSVARHHRNVADEQRLLLDLAVPRARRLYLQRNRHIQRRRICYLLLPALILGVLGRLEVVVSQRKLKARSRRVLYGRNLVEKVLQRIRLEPFERIELHLYQVRHIENCGRRRVRTLPVFGMASDTIDITVGITMISGLRNR